MRRRLVASTALIALAAVLVLGVPLGIVGARRAHSEAVGRLEREADTVAAAVDDPVEGGRPLDATALARLVHPRHWVTVIDSRGRRTAVGVPIPGAALSVRSGLARDVQVIASEPASEVSGRQRGVWLLVGLLAVGGTAAAVGLAVVQGRRLARPLERLSRTSTLLGTGDFSARASRSGIPEMDAVAEALDTTAVRIARLLGRERDLSADVATRRAPGLRLLVPSR